MQASKLLQKIGEKILRGEDGHDSDDDEGVRTWRPPKPYSQSQTGAPISVSQILRELRRLTKKKRRQFSTLVILNK